MAKQDPGVSKVLLDICMKKAKKEKMFTARWSVELSHRLYKCMEASEQNDFPCLAVHLSKLAGIALAAAEESYQCGPKE